MSAEITVWHLNGTTSRFYDVVVKSSTEDAVTFIYTSKSDGRRKVATLFPKNVSIFGLYTPEPETK